MTAPAWTDISEGELYRQQAEFCKGMAHPKRIYILTLLKGGEKSVNDLSLLTGIPQANLSQHLALMRRLGLLRSHRRGMNVYYRITDTRIVEACELVHETIAQRLKNSKEILESVSPVR